MNDNFEFHFSGLPENNEIEVPDTPKKSHGMPNMKMMSFSTDDLKKLSQLSGEDLKKGLPPEMLKMMQSMGVDVDNVVNQALSTLQNMTEDDINNMQSLFGMYGMSASDSSNDDCSGECGTCSSCDEKMTIDDMFPTGNPKYLSPEEFGSIECQSSQTLYEDFVEVYGTDSTKYLDDNTGLRNFILNDITAKLNFDDIKNMRFINSNENFILFYMEPKETTSYGFYAAVIKLPDDSFGMYIPTYCNTFDIINEPDENFTDAFLFNEDDQEYAFEGPATNVTAFRFLSANLIEFSVAFALAPVKNTLLSPKEFGTIKPIRASITKDSSMIPVGKIFSNYSTSSVLLLKDAELPMDADSYLLFAKFPSVIDEKNLRFLSDVFFNVDFNNCKLLENVELKYTSDGKLYFDIDHFGDF